ncbi:hypothetical protein VFPFJ_11074 [Purpureocillium lilacinum]|uniref:Uncharacterized protein n=1 Tax=Purpureocillium lilacinum TaxID=33203 RepID=A0A179FVD1_PURLI|nr:hypothetical protein VFPFJ_11074 [Purpureocillium lilacinum]OAQ69572.1 hypothetical protein VFPFJ_11074 [Purpureocillium lilacinum]
MPQPTTAGARRHRVEETANGHSDRETFCSLPCTGFHLLSEMPGAQCCGAVRDTDNCSWDK